MTRPFSKVPGWLLGEKPGGNAVLVYATLGQHASRAGRASLTQTTLAEETGLSIPTVQRALYRLRDLGAVTWEERKFRQGPNRYTLTPEPSPPTHHQRHSDASPVMAPTHHERRDEKVPTEPQPEEVQDSVLATLARPDPPEEATVASRSSPADEPLEGLLMGLPPPKRDAYDLMAAWCEEYVAIHHEQPDPLNRKHASGQAARIVATRTDDASWEVALQAARDAGAAGQPNIQWHLPGGGRRNGTKPVESGYGAMLRAATKGLP